MPQVVLLNGGSSSGKTSISKAFRLARSAEGDFWLGLGLDDFFSKLPDEWYGFGDHQGRFSHLGIQTRTTDDGLVTSFGPVGRNLMNAYHGAVAAAARAGLQVVVDEVIFDQDAWEGWVEALKGHDAIWVGIYCDPDVAEAREAARGDRSPGKARDSAKFAHLYPTYDLTIDTTHLTTDEAVEKLIAGLALQ